MASRQTCPSLRCVHAFGAPCIGGRLHACTLGARAHRLTQRRALRQWLDDPDAAPTFGTAAPRAALGASADFPLAFVDRSAFRVRHGVVNKERRTPCRSSRSLLPPLLPCRSS